MVDGEISAQGFQNKVYRHIGENGSLQQVHDLLGYSEHVIRRWYTTCGLAVVRLGTRAYIPKKGLLRFIGSKSFHSIKEKSAAHVDLIRSVDYEGA